MTRICPHPPFIAYKQYVMKKMYMKRNNFVFSASDSKKYANFFVICFGNTINKSYTLRGNSNVTVVYRIINPEKRIFLELKQSLT